MYTDAKPTIDERTRLIPVATVHVISQQRSHKHSTVKRRFVEIALFSTAIAIIIAAIIGVISSLPVPDPITDPPTHTSCFNTSRAYASAEALNNNINGFCQDVANNQRLFTISRTWTKVYYSNTPEEYKMTIALSRRVSGFDRDQCIASLSSIVNRCDIPSSGRDSIHWKYGGKRVKGAFEYTLDIARQNRPWPPPSKPSQRCEGWYKFIFHHFDIYGAGWASYDWGQHSLAPAINPCCGPGKKTRC